MKKTVLLLAASVLLILSVSAQHCAQSSVGITPLFFGTPGLDPLPEDLPCTVVGQAVSDTIYFQNFTYVIGYQVDSLTIDSIENLPPGLCWVMDKANNTYAGGQAGAIYVSGVSSGPPGQYKLRIIVDAYLHGLTLRNVDAEAAADLRYYVRARCASDVCTPLDTNSPYPSYIAYTPCPGPPPATISPAGTVTVCPGATQQLVASAGTGYSYKWSTGATTDTITVSAAAAYTVTVYNATDSAVSQPTTLALYTAPSALLTPAGHDSICTGDTAVISAATASLNYAWSNGATTQSIHATSGSYTLTVTDAHSCTAISTPTAIVVKPLPPAVIIHNGANLEAGSGTGYTYQWYKDGALLTGETGISLSAPGSGSYTVAVTAPNGCTALSAATVLTGIDDLNEDAAITLYPNPGEGKLMLVTNAQAAGAYTVYDALGRTIIANKITTGKTLVDMSSHPAGIYYLTVKQNESEKTIRFTIIR